MNERQLQSIEKDIQELHAITEGLFRRSLRNKAMLMAYYGPLVELVAKHTGKTKVQVMAELKKLRKAAYQKLMERIEREDPGLAARLDIRDIGDVL